MVRENATTAFESIVPHLAGLQNGWQQVPLGKLVDEARGICYGIVQPGGHIPDGVPIVRVQDIKGGKIEESASLRVNPEIAARYKRSQLRGGELLLTLVGSVGQSAVVPHKLAGWNTARAVAVIPIRSEIGARFVHYCLQTPHLQHLIEAWCTTTVQATFNLKEASLLPIPLPPAKEREAVAYILGTIDDKIELNRRMNQTLEALARAIFKSWFVDFDPVVAKAAGRKPVGMSKEMARLFPDSFEDSPLGAIPKGWRVGRLAEVVGLLNGFAFKSKDWQQSGIPVVKIGSVKPGIVDLDDVSYVSEAIAAEANRFRLKPADLLIGMTGYVGEVGLVPFTCNPPLLNQRVGKFILQKEGTENLAFTYCMTRDPDFKATVATNAHGTAQANVSAEGILSIQTILPCRECRMAFDNLCQPLFDRIMRNHSESRTLAALRDALLPKLLSGELRVADAEKEVARMK